ncbi:hypothetical protein LguiA_006128 [Lonicera macranthoides]
MAIMGCIRIHPNKEMTVDEFKAWIGQFDMDRDGRISREELKDALRSMHKWFRGWKARQAMKAADSDRSGNIDDNVEFEKLVNYAQQHLDMKIYKNDW